MNKNKIYILQSRPIIRFEYIESSTIAEAFKKQFDVLWKIAKP